VKFDVPERVRVNIEDPECSARDAFRLHLAPTDFSSCQADGFGHRPVVGVPGNMRYKVSVTAGPA